MECQIITEPEKERTWVSNSWFPRNRKTPIGISHRGALDTMKNLAAKTLRQQAERRPIGDRLAQRALLERYAVRSSILILAFGFFILGFLSLLNKHQVCGGNGISLENVPTILGGAASFLLGGFFLVTGSLVNLNRTCLHPHPVNFQ
jgi:hypothetical protein